MRFPFRRHAIAERGGRFSSISHIGDPSMRLLLLALLEHEHRARGNRQARRCCAARSGGKSKKAGEVVRPSNSCAAAFNARQRSHSRSGAADDVAEQAAPFHQGALDIAVPQAIRR